MLRTLVALPFATLLLAASAVAQEGAGGTLRQVPVELAPPADTPLQVGVVAQPPFAMEGPDGAWTGIGVDLWRMVAEREGYAYDWVPLDGGEVDAVVGGAVDIALPVTPTAETEARIDFTLPFYTATLGAAGVGRIDLWDTAKAFLSWRFLRIVLALSALLLAVGAVMWLLERRANAEQFGTTDDDVEGEPSIGRRTLRGLGSGFWWSGVTMTTIGYGDKAPITTAGRAVAMLWMLIALAITSSLTASVVAATDISASGQLSIPSDLSGLTLGAVEDSASAAYLDNEGLDHTTYPTLRAAMLDAAEGTLDAVVGPLPALRHVREDEKLDLTISPSGAEPNLMTFAIPQGSERRDALNAALLDLTTGSGWVALVERYAPE